MHPVESLRRGVGVQRGAVSQKARRWWGIVRHIVRVHIARCLLVLRVVRLLVVLVSMLLLLLLLLLEGHLCVEGHLLPVAILRMRLWVRTMWIMWVAHI